MYLNSLLSIGLFFFSIKQCFPISNDKEKCLVHSIAQISTYTVPFLVQTQTSWDSNILRLIQRIHHPIWMLKFLSVTIFGDAESKGEKSHHFRHRPDTADIGEPDLAWALIHQMHLTWFCKARPTTQTHRVFTTSSEAQAEWMHASHASARFWTYTWP